MEQGLGVIEEQNIENIIIETKIECLPEFSNLALITISGARVQQHIYKAARFINTNQIACRSSCGGIGRFRRREGLTGKIKRNHSQRESKDHI